MDNATAPIDQNPEARPLRNHTAALVLGICSIVPGVCLYGIVGVILGIIALVITKEEWKAVRANKLAYNQSQVSTLQAGRICAIIGLSLSGLYVLIVLVWLIFVGTMIGSMGSMFQGMQ